MFFEGPEKKVEVIIKKSWGSLREIPKRTWKDIVHKAKACILSQVSNEHCDAYLLSESSLFVYNDHFVMITCGTTTLVEAVTEFLKTVPVDNIETLIYERKNEHFPHYQKSNFFEDIYKLEKILPGKAWQFGDEDNHHLLLFQMGSSYQPEEDDMTVEVLMHGIQGEAKTFFKDIHQSKEKIKKLKIADIFSGFLVDDHLFEPLGYSLNAIKENWYYTIHVTPEELGSYVSFETNYFLQESLHEIVEKVLAIFQPESCDVIVFHKEQRGVEDLKGYRLRSHIEEYLGGYSVSFKHFYQPQLGPKRAFRV